MKFGKQLLTVVRACDKEWRPYWIDYSLLKKLIKEITKKNPPQNLTHANARENIFIMKNPDEVHFFKEIKSQLENVSQFFDKKSKEMREAKIILEREYNFIAKKDDQIDADVQALLEKIAKYYRELLLFESFGIFNFYGFSKILKKHDRWTGYSTKEKFMGNVVETHAFARQQNLTELLDAAKYLYERTTTLKNNSFKKADEGNETAYDRELQQARHLRYEASMLCNLKKRARADGDGSDQCSSTDENSMSPRKKKQLGESINQGTE